MADDYGKIASAPPDDTTRQPELHLRDFDGPLDLLLTLIEQQEMDIMDIPIAEVTRQYMAFLDELETLDMDAASDFLVIAADLLRLKSRLLIPRPEADDEDGEEDPREDLVFRLLAYRRTRYMALHLKMRALVYGRMAWRMPESAARLGIEIDDADACEADPDLDPAALRAAAVRIRERNKLRYQDVSEKLKVLTGREKISLKDRIIQTFEAVVRRGRCFFRELFPPSDSKPSRVNGFLAVLELVRQRRVRAEQKDPDAEIVLHSLSAAPSSEIYRELGSRIDEDYK